MKQITPLLLAVPLVLFSGSAAASSLPGADIDTTELGLGAGAGLSLAVDAPVGSAGGSFGASVNLYYLPGYCSYPACRARFDVRYLHPLIDDPSGFQLDLVVGILGSPDFRGYDNSGFWPIPLGPELGVAMSYPFTDRLTGRLNLVLGYGPRSYWGGWYYGSPAAGIEIAYKFSDAIEGTLGGNGYGDFLGLNIVF